MSQIIKNFIRNIIIESSQREGAPPTPTKYKLTMDEGPPPRSQRGGGSTSGGSPASGGAGSPPQDPETPTAEEQTLIDYQKEAVSFMITKQAEIAIAADSIIDKITGWDDPGPLADLYENAKAIDVKYGGHSTDGSTKNYATLLLGLLTSTTVDPLFLNSIVDLGATLKQGGRVVRSRLEERHRLKLKPMRFLLKESGNPFGKVLRAQIATMAASSTDVMSAALAGEAKSVVKAIAKNMDELKVLRAGGIHEDLGGMSIAAYIKNNARRAITNTALEDVAQGGAFWATTGIRDLSTAGVKGTGSEGRHTIGDLIRANNEGVPLSDSVETAIAGVNRQMTFIERTGDDAILAATRSADVDSAVKLRAKSGSVAGGAGAGAVGAALDRTGTVLLYTGRLIAAILAMGGIGGLVAIEQLIADPATTHQLDITFVTRLKIIVSNMKRKGMPVSEKIGALDIFLAEQYNNNSAYDLISRMPEAISEASGDDVASLEEFQQILAYGPQGSDT